MLYPSPFVLWDATRKNQKQIPPLFAALRGRARQGQCLPVFIVPVTARQKGGGGWTSVSQNASQFQDAPGRIGNGIGSSCASVFATTRPVQGTKPSAAAQICTPGIDRTVGGTRITMPIDDSMSTSTVG